MALRPDAGANTYSGVTTIDGGGLAISSQDALGTNSDLTINNGSLTLEADLTIDKRINLASAEANKTAVIDTNGHNVTAAGVLNGVVDSGTFIKIGAGTLTAANNDNSFAGNVEVAGGALADRRQRQQKLYRQDPRTARGLSAGLRQSGPATQLRRRLAGAGQTITISSAPLPLAATIQASQAASSVLFIPFWAAMLRLQASW